MKYSEFLEAFTGQIPLYLQDIAPDIVESIINHIKSELTNYDLEVRGFGSLSLNKTISGSVYVKFKDFNGVKAR